VIGAPFAPDASPFGAIGVAMITAADESVAMHQRVAENAWQHALKGTTAAERMRALIAEAGA
jgi:hypothetical protein